MTTLLTKLPAYCSIFQIERIYVNQVVYINMDGIKHNLNIRCSSFFLTISGTLYEVKSEHFDGHLLHLCLVREKIVYLWLLTLSSLSGIFRNVNSNSETNFAMLKSVKVIVNAHCDKLIIAFYSACLHIPQRHSKPIL